MITLPYADTHGRSMKGTLIDRQMQEAMVQITRGGHVSSAWLEEVEGGTARVQQRVVVLHGKEVRVPARSCLFIAKNKIHLILLLLIGDSFWSLQVMPPKILSGQSKKIEKIYKFSQNSEISDHQFGNSNHWIWYIFLINYPLLPLWK